MKKKYTPEDSEEDERVVDEPDEVQGSDDDWKPGAGENTGRRTSRRLRNSALAKKLRLVEPSSSEEEEESAGSEDSEGDKAKGRKGVATGRGRGRASKVQVTSTSLPAKTKGKNYTIESCEATSTTGNGPVVHSEKDFISGAFVVLKTDFRNGKSPPIWKIDGKALLQKFVPFENENKTWYKSTSTYSGWSINNKDLYYLAPVVFKTQERKESVVEFICDEIPAEDSE